MKKIKNIAVIFSVLSIIILSTATSAFATAPQIIDKLIMPPAYLIEVQSPNGGESWQTGTMQTIKWQDNTPTPPCPPGAFCSYSIELEKLYDIKLVPYYPPCTGQICPIQAYLAPYTIASKISGNSYSWKVGSVYSIINMTNGLPGGHTTAPNGSYTVQVCAQNSGRCSSSDSYFKITTPTSNNLPPVISGVTAPTSLEIGQTGTWSIQAYDPENGSLSYSVDWGDHPSCQYPYTCKESSTGASQTSTFTHSYYSTGVYKITFTVLDNAGLKTQTTSTVQVGTAQPTPSITVKSPNGGETWNVKQNNTIAWDTTGYSPSDTVYIKLYDSSKYCDPNIVGCWTTFNIANTKNTGSYIWDTNTYYDNPGPYNPLYLTDTKTTGVEYKIVIVVVGSNGATSKDYSDNYFKILPINNGNLPPEIKTINDPGSLTVGQIGTWTIVARDPENGPLSYYIDWGDSPAHNSEAKNDTNSNRFSQTSTFTHSYSSARTYAVKFTVTDSAGLTTSSHANIQVSPTNIAPNSGNNNSGANLELLEKLRAELISKIEELIKILSSLIK